MEKTWRWFGRKDRVTLEMLRQIGVEGIVTSLHDLQPGAVWSLEETAAVRDSIEAAGLRWSVVESLPVSEAIKYGGPDRDSLIDNYITSLENLGRCGIRTVCYNFMPVIDWVRTDLYRPIPGGGSTLYFDFARYAYFDIRILGREGAERDYSPEVLRKVEELEALMQAGGREELIDTIITRTQGFINGPLAVGADSPVEKFKALMRPYAGMDKAALRANLKYFLEAVMPVCGRFGIDMCIHPDDPPMPVFGMPRLCCDAADIRWILSAVDNPHNGLTFCAGSLSAGSHNDVPAMAREFAERTRFVHLRSCFTLPGGDFTEAPHIGGGVDLAELCRIFEATGRRLPMRVDHGKAILDDDVSGDNPGYGFHGRMLAFGQVCGILSTIERQTI